MPETTDRNKAGTPWHLWVIGVVALLWNSMGAFDYLMTQTKNAAYMSNFTQAQLDFFYGLPTWVVSAWAIAVWGGVIGALLLLLRRRIAVQVFLVSLLAMVMTTVHNYLLANGLEVMGDAFSLIFTGAIFLIALALYFYALRMAKRRVLV